MIATAAALAVACIGAYALWRYVWFFRDPPRSAPAEPGLLAPADGTVVYVRRVAPGEDVVVIKQGVKATVRDLMREDADEEKLVIGIFMSPFDVHFNRAPLTATVGFVRHHPSEGRNLHMGAMHWRTLVGLEPRYTGSMHIVQNERTVTQFLGEYRGTWIACYVVQIGAMSVNGIEVWHAPGERVARGATFGMIRVGSQVDLIVPWREGYEVRVRPGDRVSAGETIVIR